MRDTRSPYGGLDHGTVADPPAVLVGHDAGAVGVGEQEVVERGQEPWRGRRVGVGTGRVRQVVQLPPVLVAEGTQRRAEPLDRLAKPREAGPGLDVVDGRRPERRQVPLDHASRRGAAGSGRPIQDSART
jgi:hypothetical protein